MNIHLTFPILLEFYFISLNWFHLTTNDKTLKIWVTTRNTVYYHPIVTTMGLLTATPWE
jgi:hypothetical protein